MTALELAFATFTDVVTIAFMVTLHSNMAPAASGFGAQARDATSSGATLSVTVFAGLAEAVIVTCTAGADSAASATNVPVVAPAAIVRVAGRVTFVELLARATTFPPAGAVLVSVTVQVVLLPAISVDVGHATVLTWTPEATVS
jgi:hypothetical protein